MHVLSGALLDFDGTIVAIIAIFLVAFLLLRNFLFRPMVDLFDARTEAIDGARTAAKDMESEAGRKAERFEDAMRRLRLAAAEERERLRQDGLKLERTMLDRVRADTQRQMDQAARDLDAEARGVRKDMQTQVPVLARNIAGKLLNREVS